MLLTMLRAHGAAEKQLSLYSWPITFKRQGSFAASLLLVTLLKMLS